MRMSAIDSEPMFGDVTFFLCHTAARYMIFCLYVCLFHCCLSQGYYGCAIGKAKQTAKTEIEKLKMKDMTMQDLVKEVARM